MEKWKSGSNKDCNDNKNYCHQYQNQVLETCEPDECSNSDSNHTIKALTTMVRHASRQLYESLLPRVETRGDKGDEGDEEDDVHFFRDRRSRC